MFKTTSLVGRQGNMDSIFSEADKIFGDADSIMSTVFGNTGPQSVGVFRHNSGKYPPYNLVDISDDVQVIELAVAGFKKDELYVRTEDGKLTISGQRVPTTLTERKFFVKGISERDFSIVFDLPKHFEVSSSTLVDGILSVKLVKNVPEALKPKTIEIV